MSTPHPDDTIVALASAPGPGARAIVRISGPETKRIVATVFRPLSTSPNQKSKVQSGTIQLPDMPPFPGDLYLWSAPRSYTGQDLTEIHFVSSPPLIELLITSLMNSGARSARPGEFTLRAFLSGKRDLTQAEAVLAVIESGSREELKQSLKQLAGGVTLPLGGLREDLLNLLADVEAGLDFTDEHIEFVGKKEILLRIGKGLAQLINLQKQLQERSISGRSIRVALVGEPNVGKSSLFNHLAGLPAAIVSSLAGTTRDYLTRTISLGPMNMELIDTAGWQESGNTIEEQAQFLSCNQAQQADLLLWCIDSNSPIPETNTHLEGIPLLMVLTKCDTGFEKLDPIIPISVRSGFGIENLKKQLFSRVQALTRPALAPSLSRCRHHVDACLGHIRQAHSVVLFDEPAELLALELRLALDQLGEMVGEIYTEDLLDRIFSRFCIGK